MNEKIVDYLNALETDSNIRILLACETGSRAWGFESTDSDYDVRLVYCHPLNSYLQIGEPDSSVSKMLDDDLIDISGWELRKTLRLLVRSNMSVFERLDSSIIYMKDPSFVSALDEIAKEFYNPLAAIHHYLGMAKSAYADLIESDSYKLKRLFYALRAGACCQWIYENNSGAPPIVFDQVLERIELKISERQRIAELKSKKSEVSESYMHSGDQLLLDLILHQISIAEQKSNDLKPSKGDITKLDQLMADTLHNQR